MFIHSDGEIRKGDPPPVPGINFIASGYKYGFLVVSIPVINDGLPQGCIGTCVGLEYGCSVWCQGEYPAVFGGEQDVVAIAAAQVGENGRAGELGIIQGMYPSLPVRLVAFLGAERLEL